EAAMKLLDELNYGGTVDSHAADQLIVYMALAEGKSIIKTSNLTMHTLTCIELAKKFLPDVSFEVYKGKPTIIECIGVGFRRS
ncbi:MAG: RNA 3'-terminal phosphate cyclase, partial [Candidatus Methanomethylicia archaeon]